MKFNSLLFLALLFVFSSFVHPPKEETVTVTCKMEDCQTALNLYQFNGIGFQQIQEATAKGENVYEFKVPKSGPQFYYIGPNAQSLLITILGPEDEVVINGTCNQIRKSSFGNS